MTGRQSPRKVAWLSLLGGVALVVAIAIAALHFSEAEQIARIAREAEPGWLVAALLLQLSTYAAQGQVWRFVARAAAYPLSLADSVRLSTAKLFVDQALPSAGITGTASVARYLQKQGMAPAAVAAGVIVNLASYFMANAALVVLAVLLLPLPAAARSPIAIAMSLFVLGSIALMALVLLVLAHPMSQGGLVSRIRPLRGLLQSLTSADPAIARRPSLLGRACACQVLIVALDASTMWALVEATGQHVSYGAVFGSFVISNVFRAIGVLPGGLGTFEASSVLTLQWVGVSLPAALSATLLFRGLSFWLPMLPGAFYSRRVFAARDRTAPAAAAPYWAEKTEDLVRRLHSSLGGLTSEQAQERLVRYGPNRVSDEAPLPRLRVLWRQLRSPLLLLLIIAAAIGGLNGEWLQAGIVLSIIAATVLIGYKREYRANAAAAALRERIKARARVLRDGVPRSLSVEDIVPGDVVLLAAGNLVPADAVVLQATDAYLSEAALTGESLPVEKCAGEVAAHAGLAQRSNCVYLGTNVRSGTLKCLVVATGADTQFGAIAERLTVRTPQTDFDRGIGRFGYLLTSAMLMLVFLVFVAHMFAHRPLVETLLFSVALAVGLSPELLPAILSVNLARGAEMLARQGVLVRRLNAIENLGSMDVLCTDKTGTLTEGVVRMEGAYDPDGVRSAEVARLAHINAAFESGLASPLDDAILADAGSDLADVRKLAEVPFDFVRKRVSVVVAEGGAILLVAKGAFEHVLDDCTTAVGGGVLNEARRAALRAKYDEWSGAGVRVLAVAVRRLAEQERYTREDERELTFAGFVTFLDRPKEGAAQALADLRALGVDVKLISGDTRLVAQHVAALVGLPRERILTGAQLDELHDDALWREAERTHLFVEVDPNQKERIIRALQRMGHVVGFLGDGVNDAPAMHAADTGLSVEHAVDVAREAADFVLLQQDLNVISRGIQEGRRTFANTLKYVLTTTSANLGNMLSMAVASLFLPFLPLTAGQILLNNFLSDIPAIGIADDSVDRELVERPRRWDMRFIARYMVSFGVLSSLFDLLTFAILLWIFDAKPELFRTAWFVESLLTELVIALVVRTRRPFYRSRPGTLLLGLTGALVVLTPVIPYLPFAALLGFVPLPPVLVVAVFSITVAYVVAVETMKPWFYRRTTESPATLASFVAT